MTCGRPGAQQNSHRPLPPHTHTQLLLRPVRLAVALTEARLPVLLGWETANHRLGVVRCAPHLMVLAVATSSGSYGALYQSSAALRFLLCLLAIFSMHTRRWLVDIRRASHHWTCGSTPSRMKATSAVAIAIVQLSSDDCAGELLGSWRKSIIAGSFGTTKAPFQAVLTQRLVKKRRVDQECTPLPCSRRKLCFETRALCPQSCEISDAPPRDRPQARRAPVRLAIEFQLRT